jgi:hypothetical protein
MTKFGQSLSILALAFLVLLVAGPARAQATRTWVSGVGDDANPCSRTAPCKTFAGAISKTSASGEINILDPGGFGALTITKALTIAGFGVGTGGVLVAGTNGIVVAAGASDVVILKDLDIDGLGPTGGSLAGVQFNSGKQLVIDHCVIYGFQGSGGAGSGVNFQPSSGTSILTMTDTLVENNGSSGGPLIGSGNILIQPKGTASVIAYLNGVKSVNAFRVGIRADGTASTGTTTVTISDSVADSSGNSGIVGSTSATGGGIINLTIQNSTASNNGSFGVHSEGANSTVRLTGSTITGNATGVGTVNNAVLASFGNNSISGNTTNGAPTASISLQ